MNEQLPKLEPVYIILISYNRINYLKKTIDLIYERTKYPHYVIVVDNASTDGSQQYLKEAKVIGKVFDNLFLPENIGQSCALNAGFAFMQEWNKRRPSTDLFVTTNEDLLPPQLSPCWLERMLHLFEKYEPEGYKAISMRIERSSRMEIDEEKELISLHKSCPNVYRMARRSDFAKLGPAPFRELKKWDSNSFQTQVQSFLKGKTALSTRLYASHIGFMSENKGYDEGVKTFTVAENKKTIYLEKPYPDIDEKTNIPLKINSNADAQEHKRREEYWGTTTGIQSEKETRKKIIQRNELSKYVEEYKGKWADLGCGEYKVHEDAIGVDTYPYDSVDILHNVEDLWFFKDGELDGITASHILEHLGDTKKVLTEWDRTLKKGGILAIIVPDGEKRINTILEPSHKVSLTKTVMGRLILKFLKHNILKLEFAPNLDPRKASILCVSQKR